MPINAVNNEFWSAVQKEETRVTRGSQELGKNEFLMLLLAQLKHQDPLDPISNQDFIAQLAQFETLEQQLQMTAEISNMVDLQKFSQAVGAVGYPLSAMNEDGNLVQGVVTEVLKQADGVYLVMYGIKHKTEDGVTGIVTVIAEKVKYDDVISIGNADMSALMQRQVQGVTRLGEFVNGVVSGVQFNDDGSISALIDGVKYVGDEAVPVFGEELLLEHLLWIEGG